MSATRPSPDQLPLAGWKGLAMIVLVLAVLTALMAPAIVTPDARPAYQEIAVRR